MATAAYSDHCSWLEGLRRQHSERVNAAAPSVVWPTGQSQEEEFVSPPYYMSSEQEAISDLSAALDRELDFADFEQPVYRGALSHSMGAAVSEDDYFVEPAQWRGFGSAPESAAPMTEADWVASCPPLVARQPAFAWS